MWQKLGQFLALAHLTATENIRRPTFLLLVTSCIVLIALVPLLQMHDFGEDGKLARNSGLALHFLFGLFVAGYAAATSLSREMREGTALTVLSKPVSRNVFFLAKYAGIAAVVLAFSCCATLATLLSERMAVKFIMSHTLVGYVQDVSTGIRLLLALVVAYGIAAAVNYRTRRSFQEAAFWLLVIALLSVFFISCFFDLQGKPAAFDAHVQWRIIPVSFLVTQALLVLAAVALTLSTRLGLAPTMTISCVVFVLGLMSDYLFGQHAETSVIAALLHTVVPNWQHFWMADALNRGGMLPLPYVGLSVLYAVTYTAFALCVGVQLFRRMETT